MLSRDEVIAIALKLAATDPNYRDRTVERVDAAFSMDGGLTWTVHLVPEPLDLGGDTIIVSRTPELWLVCVDGCTGDCHWLEML